MRNKPSLFATLLGLALALPPARTGAAPDTSNSERTTRLSLSSVPWLQTRDRCTLEVLSEVGWRFTPGASARLDGHPSAPCERADLADAHAHGDLAATLPQSAADPSQFAADLDALLRHPATHCAYAMRLGDATRRAVDRLVANPGFRFSALQTGWIGFGLGGARRDGWESIRSLGRGFRPHDTPSRGIEGFYTGSVRAECGVGRQIAQYATLYELFGASAFDSVFERDEIVVGTFNQLHGTRSVLLGSEAGEFSRDGGARIASQQGRHAFSGLPGFIVHVFERSTLDDVHNQAENFVVYRVSPEAAAALAHRGGFEYYNHRNRELWELSRTLDLTAKRIYERLLYRRDATLRAALSAQKRGVLERMDAILADPFYRGFEIYVHPKGVKPVGYHVARLLDRNPRTPFRIELVLHNLHTTVYERWIAHRRSACEQLMAAAPL